MKIVRFILLSLGLLVTCASLAEAHAFLDTAEPPVGATVQKSPAVLKLWFTRRLQAGPSVVEVFDAAGKEIDRHDVKLDRDDLTLLTVSLPKLPAGTYKVTWTAVCLDTHTTHGTFTFDVAGP